MNLVRRKKNRETIMIDFGRGVARAVSLLVSQSFSTLDALASAGGRSACAVLLLASSQSVTSAPIRERANHQMIPTLEPPFHIFHIH